MITVFGLGFTGITTALYFSEKKEMKVYGIDIDEEKIKKISNYKLPFHEQNFKEY